MVRTDAGERAVLTLFKGDPRLEEPAEYGFGRDAGESMSLPSSNNGSDCAGKSSLYVARDDGLDDKSSEEIVTKLELDVFEDIASC